MAEEPKIEEELNRSNVTQDISLVFHSAGTSPQVGQYGPFNYPDAMVEQELNNYKAAIDAGDDYNAALIPADIIEKLAELRETNHNATLVQANALKISEDLSEIDFEGIDGSTMNFDNVLDAQATLLNQFQQVSQTNNQAAAQKALSNIEKLTKLTASKYNSIYGDAAWENLTYGIKLNTYNSKEIAKLQDIQSQIFEDFKLKRKEIEDLSWSKNEDKLGRAVKNLLTSAQTYDSYVESIKARAEAAKVQKNHALVMILNKSYDSLRNTLNSADPQAEMNFRNTFSEENIDRIDALVNAGHPQALDYLQKMIEQQEHIELMADISKAIFFNTKNVNVNRFNILIERNKAEESDYIAAIKKVNPGIKDEDLRNQLSLFERARNKMPNLVKSAIVEAQMKAIEEIMKEFSSVERKKKLSELRLRYALPNAAAA